MIECGVAVWHSKSEFIVMKKNTGHEIVRIVINLTSHIQRFQLLTGKYVGTSFRTNIFSSKRCFAFTVIKGFTRQWNITLVEIEIRNINK